MSIVARPYEPKDADAYFAIRSATYGNGVPTPTEERTVTGRAYVAEIDGRVAGLARINDYVCTRGQTELTSAGVASVAVSPTDRQSGAGTALIAWMVRHAREEGFLVSALYPFRAPFYRKSGYEGVGRRMNISCPMPRLPKLRSELVVRNLVPDDWELLRSCYEAFARARSGFHIRDEKRWREALSGRDHPTAYAFGDPVEAYAIVNHKSAFWESQQIAEVAWSTQRGHQAILAWFGGLGANKTHIDWAEPSDSPFVARYNDQGIDVKLGQSIMYRVLNVPEAVSRLRCDDSGEFSLEVGDDLVPENRGPWRIAYSPTGVEVSKTAAADLSLDIRQFGCAFMGEPGIFDLARNGLATVRDRRALMSAARLLVPIPVGCWDYF